MESERHLNKVQDTTEENISPDKNLDFTDEIYERQLTGSLNQEVSPANQLIAGFGNLKGQKKTSLDVNNSRGDSNKMFIEQKNSDFDSGRIRSESVVSTEEADEEDKMGTFQTFAALCKGYCAINILILPKQFENGGWLIGTIAISVAVIFVLYCALKLVKCGIKTGLYNYSQIAEAAMGSRGKVFVDVLLGLCQFSFTIAQITFTLNCLQKNLF